MIKKILLTLGLLLIGLVNITFGYTVKENCFATPTNPNFPWSCVDIDLGENYSFYGSYGIDNTVNNGFTIYNGNNEYFLFRTFNGSYYSYILGFFSEDGYFNTLNFFNDENGNNVNNGYMFYYTGINYCRVDDTTNDSNFRVCQKNYMSSSAGNLLTYNHNIEDTLNYISGANIVSWKILLNTYPNEGNNIICGIYDNNRAICVYPLGHTSIGNRQTNCNNSYCYYSGVSRGYVAGMGFNDVLNVLDDYGISQSPFYVNGGGTGIDEIPENGFPDTNRGVFESYAEQGYVLSRCYSDFSLDNLATATGGIDQFYETELDDGVYYTGATVLDLFVEYGYGNSFESFFDYWYQTYNQSLLNDSPVKYVGLSKGLWNMSNKYYYAGLSNKYVDYTKFYNYCSYFVNFDGDWDAEYTGPQLPNDVANQLAPSQSAIDYLSGFIHSQNSGNNQNFDADTFFTSLTTKFDRLLNNINGSFVGIIPGYILVIMMALIFIRIISH